MYMKFNVVDNTGVLSIVAISNISHKRHNIKIGDILIGVVLHTKTHSPIKEKTIIKALVIRMKKIYSLLDYSNYKFNDNAVILIDNNNIPIGNRIYGLISIKCKKYKLSKILNISNKFI